MGINVGHISGRVVKTEQCTSRNGNGYTSIDLDVPEWKNGQETLGRYSFCLFGETSKFANTLQAGDIVMVSYKLKLNDRGYSDLQTTGVTLLQRGQGAQASPMTYTAPAPAQPRQQAAPQYAPQPPQYNELEIF